MKKIKTIVFLLELISYSRATVHYWAITIALAMPESPEAGVLEYYTNCKLASMAYVQLCA